MPSHAVTLLLVGSGSTNAIFSLLGIVGTGLVLASRRLRAWLLVTGGAGVVTSTLVYPLYLPVVMAPVIAATGNQSIVPAADTM